MTIRLSRDERDRSSISSVCCDNISRLNSDRGWLLAPLWRFKPNEISAISMLDKIQSSHAERSTIPLSANGFCPLHFGQSPISSRFFPRLFLLITPLSFFFSLSILLATRFVANLIIRARSPCFIKSRGIHLANLIRSGAAVTRIDLRAGRKVTAQRTCC